jgi:hypothetical protein
MFTAITPAAFCVTATRSVKSSLVIQFFLNTTSRSNQWQHGQAAANGKAPMRKKTRNNCPVHINPE